MSYNPFRPQQRTAVITLDNGTKVRAEILIPENAKPTWHAELEKRMVRNFNRSQPHAVHKAVKIHILRN